MADICKEGRIPTVEEYCAFRTQHIQYPDDVKPQVIGNVLVSI